MNRKAFVAILAGSTLSFTAWAWAQQGTTPQQPPTGSIGQGMMGAQGPQGSTGVGSGMMGQQGGSGPGGMMGAQTPQGRRGPGPGAMGPPYGGGTPRGMMGSMRGLSLYERPLISEMLSLQAQLSLTPDQVQRLQTLRTDFEKEAIKRVSRDPGGRSGPLHPAGGQPAGPLQDRGPGEEDRGAPRGAALCPDQDTGTGPRRLEPGAVAEVPVHGALDGADGTPWRPVAAGPARSGSLRGVRDDGSRHDGWLRSRWGLRSRRHEALIKRAVTEGLDADGEPLDRTMPRWQMSERDLNDLIAYLKQLQ